MKVAITGSSGFVGSALVRALRQSGDEVIAVPRGTAEIGDAEAVVNLAGAPIAVRWTKRRKQEILASRVEGTRRIVDAINRRGTPVRVLVSASAIGFYGNRGDEVLSEESTAGTDFLAAVVREWETAAAAAVVRSVQLRFGIVLGSGGGALAKMLPPFRMGMGGRLGAGTQWMSWISLHDLVRAIRLAIDDASVSGPANAVAPNAVTNAEFTATLGRVLRRPAMMPVPVFALRALFGEMASLTLLASQRVAPMRLERAGFRFEHPTLEGALRHELSA
ncbi:MAG TPA: TIGR01777 family oxidoreductase [Gemmatimonadaceae bacterium]